MPAIDPARAGRPVEPPPLTTSGAAMQRPAGPTDASAPTRRWHSADLLGTHRDVEIEHGPVVYRLRLTALGKLLLTK